jgi:aldehyde:ferredoxin oxidoreductase
MTTFGWAGKILDVDLTSGAIGTRDTMSYAHDWLGGRILAARIAWDEIPVGTGPYDPANRVIISTGPLTGTLAPTSGRTIMTSLSPRTYPFAWHTHSTLGGWFGPELKYAGFDAVVVHGRAEQPVILEIRDQEARLVAAGDLWGQDAREAQLTLKERMGQETQVLTIGPAGENLVRLATVQHAEENAAAHSGFGAVWGSKNLKAITVRGTGGVRIARPEALLKEVAAAGTFQVSPYIGTLINTGDQALRPICSQACTSHCFVSRFGKAADGRRIPGQCMGAYAWYGEDNMQSCRYEGGDLHVPGGANFGLCEEATLHELCNSLGLDLWFRLVMQPWFVRCEQLGIREIRGHPIRPGDVFWFEAFMHDLAHRRGLGELFAEDLVRAVDELEGELPPELIRLGRAMEFGFGFASHREGRIWDEEPLPFWVISAMMYASESRDPTIGTHQAVLLLADFVLRDQELARRQFRLLSERVWGDPEALEPTFERKAPVAIWAQHQHMLIDSLTMCDFAYPQLMRPIWDEAEWRRMEDVSGDLDLDLRLMAAVTGMDLTRADLFRIAERGFTLERALLARAGRTRRMEQDTLGPHFQLPCRADGTAIDEAGFARLLDEYFAARGWDLELGWPQDDQLRAMGLEDVAAELSRLRRDWTTVRGPDVPATAGSAAVT